MLDAELAQGAPDLGRGVPLYFLKSGSNQDGDWSGGEAGATIRGAGRRPSGGARRRGIVIKSTKAQIVFAWGFVGAVWLACGLHVFSRYPEVSIDSLAGLRFFTVDTGLAVLVLGAAHYVLQLGLMKVLDRVDIDPGDKPSMMRLNRAGLLMIFLEVVVIYQAAHYTFRTFVL